MQEPGEEAGAGYVSCSAVLYFTWPPFLEFLDTGWGLLASEDQEGFARWIEDFGARGPVVILVAYDRWVADRS